jgi:hypothetical protein
MLVTPVKDTVWWNTPGGTVTEHRDASTANCSLILYDDEGIVTFEWNSPANTVVTAVDRSWQFPRYAKVPVAMQVGDQWVSNRASSVIIEAVADGNSISFATDTALTDMLQPAGQIVVKTKTGDLSLRLTHAKISTLLDRASQCRESIRR